MIWIHYQQNVNMSIHAVGCCVTSPMYAPISIAMASAPESPFACASVVNYIQLFSDDYSSYLHHLLYDFTVLNPKANVNHLCDSRRLSLKVTNNIYH